MATIPDLQSVQRRVPQPVGGIVSLRGGVNYTPAANAIGASVDNLRTKSDDFDVARADAAVLQAHVAATNELTDDNYATYEERYQKRMDTAMESASKFIKTPSRAAEFGIKGQVFMTHGLEEVNKLADAKRVDIGRGNLIEGLASNAQAAGKATDDATSIAFIHSSNDLIQGALSSGLIDHARASELSLKTAEDHALMRIEQMSPEDQIKVLTGKGKTSSAGPTTIPSLYPDEQPQMQPLLDHHNDIVKSGQVVHNKDGSYSTLKTITTEDVVPGKTAIIPTVWDGKIVSNSVAIERAKASGVQWPTFNSDAEAEVADKRLHDHFKAPSTQDAAPQQSLADFLTPENRLSALNKAQSELVSQYNLQERMQKKALDDSFNNGINTIYSEGGANGVSSIPTSTFAAWDPSMKKAATELADSLSKGKPPQTDWGMFTALKTQAVEDPNGFANMNMMEVRPHMADAQYEQLVNMQSEIAKGDTSKATAMRSNDAAMAQMIAPLGLTSAKNPKKLADFQNVMELRRQDYLGANPKMKEVPPDVWQKMVGDELITGHSLDGSTHWFGPNGTAMPRYQADAQRNRFIPDDRWDSVIARLHQKSMPLTDENIWNTYQDILAAGKPGG